ncbi:dTDP-4-dehydrorhamnose 3,5-epimerase family protein [Prosthecomicrobium sp. N25]|uniref:dTDP-4-dehydrorhamnose 3,5-epimerase family protein n=1 Tax=Prosthecomicrobium sp. N25 TaxID=3129254 RepID=UPI003076A278
MDFTPLALEGAWIITPHHRTDTRGSFTKLFSAEDFLEHGLDARVAQVNASHSPDRGTLRGLHLQRHPASEAKTISCVRGRVYDVLADLRPRSATFGRWVAVELAAADRRMVHVPAGCAHGYMTLEADTEVIYTASRPYRPSLEQVVRYCDPFFAIEWPFEPLVISEKDRDAPDFMHRLYG